MCFINKRDKSMNIAIHLGGGQRIFYPLKILCIKILYRFVLRKPFKKNIYEFQKNGGKLGSSCDIHSSVVFGSEPYLIEIGNKVRITEGCKFITHDGGMWVLRNLYPDMKDADKFGKIIIQDNVNIGWNVIIMPGVTIGENSVIGCGAIVTKDISANSVAAGIPAKIIETIDEYYKKNEEKVLHTKKLSPQQKKKIIEKVFYGEK